MNSGQGSASGIIFDRNVGLGAASMERRQREERAWHDCREKVRMAFELTGTVLHHKGHLDVAAAGAEAIAEVAKIWAAFEGPELCLGALLADENPPPAMLRAALGSPQAEQPGIFQRERERAVFLAWTWLREHLQ